MLSITVGDNGLSAPVSSVNWIVFKALVEYVCNAAQIEPEETEKTEIVHRQVSEWMNGRVFERKASVYQKAEFLFRLGWNALIMIGSIALVYKYLIS